MIFLNSWLKSFFTDFSLFIYLLHLRFFLFSFCSRSCIFIPHHLMFCFFFHQIFDGSFLLSFSHDGFDRIAFLSLISRLWFILRVFLLSWDEQISSSQAVLGFKLATFPPHNKSCLTSCLFPHSFTIKIHIQQNHVCIYREETAVFLLKILYRGCNYDLKSCSVFLSRGSCSNPWLSLKWAALPSSSIFFFKEINK